MAQQLTIRFGTLHDQAGPPKHDGTLTIADGRVAEVSERRSRVPGDARVINAACVIPGLVNAHGHLEQDAGADTVGRYAATTPTRRALEAAYHARQTVRSGVTTLRDLGASNRIAIELRNMIAHGHVPGPTVVAAGRAICMTGGHGAFVGREADGPEQVRSAVREEHWDGADVIKFIATGGVLTPGSVPGAQELSEEELRAGVAEAHRHGMHAAAHAIGTAGIKAALRAGIDSVEHGFLIDEEGIELLLACEGYLVPTLAALRCITDAGTQAGLPDYVVHKAGEIAEQAEANLRRAYQAGVRIAAGSDAGTPFNDHGGFAYELELMHSMLGMSPAEVLQAATVTAAELLGVRRGTLAVGEVADLVAIGKDIYEDLGVLRDPMLVIKAGKIVYTRDEAPGQS
jgi:imidazolonepropionase-like amidohydrolase